MKLPAAAAAAASLALFAASPGANAQQAADSAMNLTVYTNGLALVDEVRTLAPSGSDRLRIDGIGPQAIADSLIFATAEDVTVREIALDSDILSERALLKRSLGKTIKVARINPATGAEIIEDATVLSITDGIVLKIGDRIETTVPGRLIFDNVPADLSAQPALSVRMAAPLTQETPARLAYLTDGLSWDAVYTIVLTPALTTANLDGWARITNQAGIDLGPAQLSLVAGSVNRERAPMQGKILMRAEAMAADAGSSAPTRDELAAFHLYRMPDVVTLADRETKQLSLMSAEGAVTQRVLEFRSSAPVYGSMRGVAQPVHAMQKVSFVNDVASGLGMPLPAGLVRAYVPDADGALRFVGEDRINNVPVGEDAALDLGRAFDITMTRQQTSFRSLGDRASEAGFTLKLKNGGTAPARVSVIEDIAGDWEMLQASLPHERDGLSAKWVVKVPAKGAVDLVYSVRVRR